MTLAATVVRHCGNAIVLSLLTDEFVSLWGHVAAYLAMQGRAWLEVHRVNLWPLIKDMLAKTASCSSVREFNAKGFSDLGKGQRGQGRGLAAPIDKSFFATGFLLSLLACLIFSARSTSLPETVRMRCLISASVVCRRRNM